MSVCICICIYTHIYIYIQLPSADPPPCPNVRTIGVAVVQNRFSASLHGQLIPSRLPALRGHTLSLVGRTLHTKSITKCNDKHNGTPANFENAPKFSCICLAVLPTVMKNKTECPTIFKTNDFKMRQNLHALALF